MAKTPPEYYVITLKGERGNYPLLDENGTPTTEGDDIIFELDSLGYQAEITESDG